MGLPTKVLRALIDMGATPDMLLAASVAAEERQRADAAAAKAEAAAAVRVLYITPAVRAEVIARDGFVCTYCGSDVSVPHLDHVMPSSRGGASVVENLVVSCKSCNSSKKDRTPKEWRGA
jgi:hypothetical protein